MCEIFGRLLADIRTQWQFSQLVLIKWHKAKKAGFSPRNLAASCLSEAACTILDKSHWDKRHGVFYIFVPIKYYLPSPCLMLSSHEHNELDCPLKPETTLSRGGREDFYCHNWESTPGQVLCLDFVQDHSFASCSMMHLIPNKFHLRLVQHCYGSLTASQLPLTITLFSASELFAWLHRFLRIKFRPCLG